MYGWFIVSLGFNTKGHSFELELSLFQWGLQLKRKPIKGLFLVQVGPLSVTIWDNEAANTWLSSKISEAFAEEVNYDSKAN